VAKSKYARKVQTRPSKPAKVVAHKAVAPVVRTGTAPPHPPLSNGRVHVFVDDQNLFYGIVNQHRGPGYRFDFGRLLLAAARDAAGNARGVGTAYVAGIIPDDDLLALKTAGVKALFRPGAPMDEIVDFVKGLRS